MPMPLSPATIAVPNLVRWYVCTATPSATSSRHSPAPSSCAATAAVSSSSHSVVIGTTAPSVLLT